VYGVYIDGGLLTVSAGGGAAGAEAEAPCTAPHTAAKSRAAAVRSTRSTRSNRLRQRGHHEGSPVRRQPQFGHASISDFVGIPEQDLNLKRGNKEADSSAVNIVLVPALLLLLGLVFYKKVIEPKKAGDSKGAKVKPGKAKANKADKGNRKAVAMAETKPDKKAEKRADKADKKAVKARATAGAGRMGSVL
jgi:hypothetical protein